MARKRRLILHGAVMLAASSLAPATVRQTGRETPAPAARQSARQTTRTAAGYLKPAPGRPRSPDDAQEQHRTVSPDLNRAIHHLPFDPYTVPHQPVIFVASDTRTGETLRRIPVRWPARYVASVEWLSERAVVARGESRYLAVLDVETGRQTHNLIGSNFAPSPDGTQIVYSHDFNPRYGEVPQEYRNDYVLLSLVGRRPDSGRVAGRFDSGNFKIVYPAPLPWGEVRREAVESPAERHRITVPFVWSPDSRKVAFVERQGERLWLVVLTTAASDNDITADVRRFGLGDGVKNVSSISWEPGGGRIRVASGEVSFFVDTQTPAN